jgi:hypothetical protein
MSFVSDLDISEEANAEGKIFTSKDMTKKSSHHLEVDSESDQEKEKRPAAKK